MRAGPAAFTPLAADYARYRPGYPAEILPELAAACGLTPDWIVADIGSGTGNLARLFLAAGHRVIGIEPNHEMREAGERLLAAYPAFRSIAGAAERIPLAAQSVDLIAVGQALHWFDADRAKNEFRRVLRPEGWVAVVWNDRLRDTTAFTREYDALTRTRANASPSPDAAASLATGLDRLFDAAAPRHAGFPHAQRLDLPGLLGRARSSGYLPQPGAPGHDELTARMSDLFQRHQHDGAVTFHYVAQLYVGRLRA